MSNLGHLLLAPVVGLVFSQPLAPIQLFTETEIAGAARNYVIKEFKTDPKTIKAINGGYREEASVELFLIPNAWPPPVPTPTFGAPFK